jgi:hypothetical protein
MTANYELPSVVEKRVRFFDGQFLQDKDFIDEQKYHLDRERRHLRLLHVAGIADGLAVSASASEPNKVTVAPGTAIDSDGRQLALAQTATVDLDAGTFNDEQGVELYISYQESAEDVQTTGSSDFTRWLERPKLEAIAPGGAYAGATPPVLLARVALDSAGRVTVDDTVRAYSGLRLPGPAADAPTLRSTAAGRVALTGSLTVDGNVGIGTADPKRSLHVEGTEIHSGGSSAGFSFADRNVGSFVENPRPGGQRWVWYASDGTARLWSGVDRLQVDWAGGVTLKSLTVQGDLQAGGAASVQGNLLVTGNVGIDATTPNSDLQIGNFEAQNRYLTLKVKGGNAYRAGVRLWAYQENYGYSIEFDERLATGNGLHIRTHSITAEEVSRVFVGLNGNVGIGTTTPEQKLTVNGELRFTGGTTISSAGRLHIFGEEILFLLNRGGVVVGKHWGGNGNLHVDGTFSQASDARLKERIRRLERPLDKLTEVRGVSYLPRQIGRRANRSEERPAIGVLAQEVEAVFPELVSTPGGQSYKGVDYGGLTAVLLEAVKELKTALDALRERVAALQAHA